MNSASLICKIQSPEILALNMCVFIYSNPGRHFERYCFEDYSGTTTQQMPKRCRCWTTIIEHLASIKKLKNFDKWITPKFEWG